MLVITRGNETWSVEVKSALTATPVDGHGLRRLAERCGSDDRGGVVLDPGCSTFGLGNVRDLAARLARLWDMERVGNPASRQILSSTDVRDDDGCDKHPALSKRAGTRSRPRPRSLLNRVRPSKSPPACVRRGA
jgi:hypothetical protein